jgi:hypothetical protein
VLNADDPNADFNPGAYCGDPATEPCVDYPGADDVRFCGERRYHLAHPFDDKICPGYGHTKIGVGPDYAELLAAARVLFPLFAPSGPNPETTFNLGDLGVQMEAEKHRFSALLLHWEKKGTYAASRLYESDELLATAIGLIVYAAQYAAPSAEL